MGALLGCSGHEPTTTAPIEAVSLADDQRAAKGASGAHRLVPKSADVSPVASRTATSTAFIASNTAVSNFPR